MADYTVTAHKEVCGLGSEMWTLAARTAHGTVSAGSVMRHGDVYDVRTYAGAKCFRGTEAYEVRMAAVERFTVHELSTSLGADALWNRLTEAAEDSELDVIEAVALRAGILWNCPVCPGGWTNTEQDEECGCCGTPRGEGTS